MPDLIVLVPSRGRPEAAKGFAEAFDMTRTADSVVIFVVDEDDPEVGRYNTNEVRAGGAGLHITPSHTMVDALNYAAQMQAARNDVHTPFAVGFMGDDHRPRTVGWDAQYLAALREMGTGIVYGNDLLQGHRLPTQCAMTSDIVRALGYMAPPALKHLYVDDTWLTWGKALDRLRYLKDVIVEHRHPLAGKAAWDEGYRRVNDGAVAEHDRLAFEEYKRDELEADLVKLRALLSVAA